jgi:hypothetical protein
MVPRSQKGRGAKLAFATGVNLFQGMADVAKNRRREMTEQANARKQGLAHVVQSARRGKDKDFANFKSAIEARDRLRTSGSLAHPVAHKKSGQTR